MSSERIGPITNEFQLYISENEPHFGQQGKESNENKNINFAFNFMNESKQFSLQRNCGNFDPLR